MAEIDELKAKAQAAIDGRRDWLIDIARAVLDNPEPGFCEVKTSRLVGDKLNELGIDHESGIALTGIKGYLRGGGPGPTVAVLGELDSLRVLGHPHADPQTGAAHACGHHCQVGMMLGVAVGLQVAEVKRALAGNVALMAVPAEEFIDVEYRWGLRQDGKLGLLARIHRRTALGTALEEARGCSSESGIMVLEQKPARKQGAPNRCCHRTNPTVSASSLTTIAWWPMPACSCRPP